MTSTRLEQFANDLAAATSAGSVKWKQEDEDSFLAKTDQGGVRIITQSATRVTLQVLSPEGKVLRSLSTDPDFPGSWRDWERSLFRLRDEASYEASGTADVLDSLRDAWKLNDSQEDDIPF